MTVASQKDRNETSLLAIFLGSSTAIAIVSLLLDYLCTQVGGQPSRVLLGSSVLAGCLGGTACVQKRLREREQLETLKDRLSTLTEMNLNIRNALMVLTFYSVQIGDQKGVNLVSEALLRIQRTLDQVVSKWRLDDSVPEAEQHRVRTAVYGSRYARWSDKAV